MEIATVRDGTAADQGLCGVFWEEWFLRVLQDSMDRKVDVLTLIRACGTLRYFVGAGLLVVGVAGVLGGVGDHDVGVHVVDAGRDRCEESSGPVCGPFVEWVMTVQRMGLY